MAIMLPEIPRECTPNSLEEIMFDSLKRLPDDYYVFHSFTIVNVVDGIINESETDFVVFNPSLGILCIEAKAGMIRCENAEWYYGSGLKMRHGGPYLQAQSNKYKLIHYIKDKGFEEILNRCKVSHAVWFPSITESYLQNIEFPTDGSPEITMTSNDLENPENSIKRILSYKVNSKYDTVTDLEAYEVRKLVKAVLCPSFDLVPSIKNTINQNRIIFNRLLKEQSRILDFLEEQPSAAISGIAGSGKTMIAMEKARRCAETGEKTLVLCYNRLLCDCLRDNYKFDDVEIYTIDGFACKICNTDTPDMGKLYEVIMELFYSGNPFPYHHIIIDEGQDFGQDKISENDILDLLCSIVLDDSIKGSFYIFYDKMQLVQGNAIPSCISDADCKMTLHINCRNTENIAITSIRPLDDDRNVKCIKGAIKGDSPTIVIDADNDALRNQLDECLNDLISNEIEDITILTCKTLETSFMYEYIKDGYYRYGGRKIRTTSCRKFKGLESDVILLVDIDKDILISEKANLFYVGSSRARFSLSMFAGMSDEDCNEVLTHFKKNKNKRPKKALAAFLNSRLKS